MDSEIRENRTKVSAPPPRWSKPGGDAVLTSFDFCYLLVTAKSAAQFAVMVVSEISAQKLRDLWL